MWYLIVSIPDLCHLSYFYNFGPVHICHSVIFIANTVLSKRCSRLNIFLSEEGEMFYSKMTEMTVFLLSGLEVEEPTESSSSDQESFWPSLNRYLFYNKYSKNLID